MQCAGLWHRAPFAAAGCLLLFLPLARVRADDSYRLTLKVDPPSAGQVIGGGMIAAGGLAAIEAVPAVGFQFTGWTGGGLVGAGDLSTTVLVDSAREVTAHFTGSFVGTAEYFFDADPGQGHGTAVAAANGSASFTADTSALTLGTHTLYLRARLGDGEWGPVTPYPFAVETLGPGEKVTALETFVDTDPGRGLATPVTPTRGVIGTDSVVDATLSLAGFPLGTRVINLRACGPSHLWGPPIPLTTALEPSDRTEVPTQLEYTWDPSNPEWTAVAANPPGGSPQAQVPLALDVATLGLGTRLLYLRGVDTSGSRGLVYTLPVAIVPDSLTGHAPPPAKWVTYLQNAGGVVAGTYQEFPFSDPLTPLNQSLNLSLAGLPSGLTADVAAYVVSQTGETSPVAVATFAVVVEGSNGYAAWKDTAGFFTAAEKADPAVSGMDADPDGDGLSNALEFACGTHPRTSSVGMGPMTAFSNGKLTITCRQLAGGSGQRAFNYTANGVRYTVEYSHLLGGDWASGGNERFQVVSVTSNGDGTDTVVVEADASVTHGQATTFLRLKITLL